MDINREFISTENTYTGQNQPKYIVIHETDNFSEGAGARRHAQAQAAGDLSVSVHYYCGSDGVYQAAEHADGTYSVGHEYSDSHPVQDATNRNTINVEICVNPDGDYTRARENAIALTRYLLKNTGIPADRVIRHFDATGKHCPRNMMDDPSLWEDFKSKIQGKDDPIHSTEGGLALRGTVVTEHDPLLIRKSPDGERVASIPKGEEVEILELGNEWHKVRYEGHTGYSAAKYLSVSGGAKYVAACTGDGVRVRRTPDFGDNIVRFLNKGNLFDVLGTSGVWTHISVGGEEGYIYSTYVKRV
ncbi:MAG: amidase [Lachnospiraceae bacterium]|nr:amidase [Lachnospiraceae bacterium]